jgi:cyclopropane fatty-acyl-phospholipid synthase-like methyltransferase
MGKETGKPFSQACENNKDPILAILRQCLVPGSQVLELGSGTGQHARYFAEQLPEVRWQPTDVAPNLAGIESWCADYAGDNLLAPRELDVRSASWSLEISDTLFTANILHIMAWSAVEALFRYLAQHAPAGNQFLVYGPFNYGGKYTSDSNASFDKWLGIQNPESAIRDFEDVDALARAAGYALVADHAMPANNRLLHWRRSA